MQCVPLKNYLGVLGDALSQLQVLLPLPRPTSRPCGKVSHVQYLKTVYFCLSFLSSIFRIITCYSALWVAAC